MVTGKSICNGVKSPHCRTEAGKAPQTATWLCPKDPSLTRKAVWVLEVWSLFAMAQVAIPYMLEVSHNCVSENRKASLNNCMGSEQSGYAKRLEGHNTREGERTRERAIEFRDRQPDYWFWNFFCVYSCVCVGAHVCMSVEVRGPWSVIPQELSTLLL